MKLLDILNEIRINKPTLKVFKAENIEIEEREDDTPAISFKLLDRKTGDVISPEAGIWWNEGTWENRNYPVAVIDWHDSSKSNISNVKKRLDKLNIKTDYFSEH